MAMLILSQADSLEQEKKNRDRRIKKNIFDLFAYLTISMIDSIQIEIFINEKQRYVFYVNFEPKGWGNH